MYPSEASHVACLCTNCEELVLMPSRFEANDNTQRCWIGAIPET